MYNETTLDFATDMPLAVLSHVTETPKEPRLYTLEEYLRREEKSTELHEYYNGIITKLPMARVPHNTITANMTAELTLAARAAKAANKKYFVMAGQQLVYLPKLNFGLYPDILVVSETPQCFDKNEVLLINPLLIVEVLSKSTKKYDRTEKFDEYRTLDSFREYVLIDQKRCHIELRYRETPDTWRYTEVTDMQGSIFLKSLGCSILVANIYDNINL
jgi:Uma2 family endonuclease